MKCDHSTITAGKSRKEQMMSDLFPVPEEWKKRALMTEAQYRDAYAAAKKDPDGFWGKEAQRLDWANPFTKVKNVSWDPDNLHIKWFEDGALNVAANCIARHLEKRGNQTAIIWEGDDPKDSKNITYRQLHEEVCRFANELKSRVVKKGDRVTIYMPMIPEAAYAMLACARLGAVHSVVFGGFSPDSIAGRIIDCDSRIVITADEGLRGGKPIPLKKNTDEALEKAGIVTSVVVVRRTGGAVTMKSGRDVWYHEEAAKVSADCPAEAMNAEDPLFILYTSGSTGKPKGVLHTTGGYLLWVSWTHQYVFDYHEGDIYWCTADVGWVTGHSYIVYGPLANGAVTLMFEGVPNYPTTSRFWEVIDKHKVNIFYTAPTAIRALMRDGDAPVKKTSRASLRLLRSVYGDHQRFFGTYFKTYRGKYFTGDGCRRDEDGYYWITGRVDDVINVSGHRIGTAEVESALVSHAKVAEAAVVAYPHEIKGQAIYAFVTLNAGEDGSDDLRKELVQEVRHDIGALAAPEKIHFTPALPKTRSGKIMRRILRKIAEGASEGFGDTSTLAAPTIVDSLL